MSRNRHIDTNRKQSLDELDQQTWNGPAGGHRTLDPTFGPRPHPHGPHGHRHLPGYRPHHDSGGHIPPRSAFGGSGDDGFSGRAVKVLGTILPAEVVHWLLRAVSYGPPEIVAIFKVEVAAIQASLTHLKASGAETPLFVPEDIQAGKGTLRSMTPVMTDNETSVCLHNLFWGPDEVQAIAFLSLVVLRLNAVGCAAAAANEDEEA